MLATERVSGHFVLWVFRTDLIRSKVVIKRLLRQRTFDYILGRYYE
jgi:hypothetical protein